MMDSNILLPPMGTPMTGIEFSKGLREVMVENSYRTTCFFLQVYDFILLSMLFFSFMYLFKNVSFHFCLLHHTTVYC